MSTARHFQSILRLRISHQVDYATTGIRTHVPTASCGKHSLNGIPYNLYKVTSHLKGNSFLTVDHEFKGNTLGSKTAHSVGAFRIINMGVKGFKDTTNTSYTSGYHDMIANHTICRDHIQCICHMKVQNKIQDRHQIEHGYMARSSVTRTVTTPHTPPQPCYIECSEIE